jgi:hypothetical protein
MSFANLRAAVDRLLRQMPKNKIAIEIDDALKEIAKNGGDKAPAKTAAKAKPAAKKDGTFDRDAYQSEYLKDYREAKAAGITVDQLRARREGIPVKEYRARKAKAKEAKRKKAAKG